MYSSQCQLCLIFYVSDSRLLRFVDMGHHSRHTRLLFFDERWPGVLENELNASGQRTRVIEDCLNG
jgi:hypothetical protein